MSSEPETKPWWQSRTVWANVLSILFAVLSLAGVKLPEGLTQDQVLPVVLGIAGIVGLYLRGKTSKPLTKFTTKGKSA